MSDRRADRPTPREPVRTMEMPAFARPAGATSPTPIRGIDLRTSLPPAPAEWASTGGASFIVDGNGLLLAFDRTMERLTGWSAYEVLGRSKDLGIFDEAGDDGVRRFRSRPLYAGSLSDLLGSETRTLTLSHKSGMQLEVEALLTPLGGAGNNQRVAVEIQRLVRQTRAGEAAVSMTLIDPVTSLPAEALFLERLAGSYAAAISAGRPLSVLLAEIDDFSGLSYLLGKMVSDGILCRIAGVLQRTLRGDDLVARLGDARFGIILEGAGRGPARAIGGRLRQQIEKFSLEEVTGVALTVTLSIGVACCPADGESALELFTRSEEALTEAQRLGRNRVWCYVRRPRVLVSTAVLIDTAQPELLGMTLNLSNSGMFVESRRAIPVGTRLPLSFRLPGQPGPLHVIGHVTRCAPPGEASPSDAPGLGIEFERYSDEDRRQLETFLHDSLEEEAAVTV